MMNFQRQMPQTPQKALCTFTVTLLTASVTSACDSTPSNAAAAILAVGSCLWDLRFARHPDEEECRGLQQSTEASPMPCMLPRLTLLAGQFKMLKLNVLLTVLLRTGIGGGGAGLGFLFLCLMARQACPCADTHWRSCLGRLMIAALRIAAAQLVAMDLATCGLFNSHR